VWVGFITNGYMIRGFEFELQTEPNNKDTREREKVSQSVAARGRQ
jgi:hypothetical protein